MACRILLVDDYEAVRTGIRSLLSSRPEWKVCGEAADGLEAVERAKALRPDVVLMDISMPRMGGLEATRVLRAELPETKIIIVSQNDPEVARRQAAEVGAAAYLIKSELPHALVPTISTFLTPRNGGHGDASPMTETSLGAGWLDGGGALGQMIRQHDWAHTPLGPIDQWPQSLRTSVNLMLDSQHAMWIGWGPEATFLYNDAYIQVLSEAKHPWALGKPTAEIWSEIWDVCGPLAEKVFQKGEASFVDEVRLIMNRGDYLEETYYSFSYSPIRDESGKVAGLFCPSTEVTPKVINARRLRTLSELAAHALLQKTTKAACESAARTLQENPDDIPFALVYLIDASGKNAILEQACGVPKEMPLVAAQSVGLSEAGAHGLWPIATVVKTRQSQVVPVHEVEGLPLGVAQQRISEAITLPMSTRGEDRTDGVLIVGVNPARRLDTEYRTFFELVAGQIASAIQNARAAEEGNQRLEALAELDRAKTTFFSNVSHEFRTPLTLMLGPVEELLSRSHTDLSPAAKSQLELVNRNGFRLLRLVNTLLDFSRIEAGRMQATYEPTDLAAFTAELASVFRSATERAGLHLELDCPPLPEPVFVDRNMWEKIVLNLISNAFKFTFEGTISVALTTVGNEAELRVRDTGVGIPPQEIPRLFDRFHRVENTRSRTHEGSGIGLALVQELAKLHGGSVRAGSVVGKGSTFIVRLPLGKDHLAADRIGRARSLSTTAVGAAPFVEEALRWLPDASSLEIESEILPLEELLPVPCPPGSNDDRPLIVVADDNSDMRQYLVRMLSERYQVEAAADGEAALASIRKQPPELVLTDVMMPNLDGFGLLRELRADPGTRNIPIILLSARAGEESRVEGMEKGADDYLVKPFSARELLARVQTHLELARVRKESEAALSRRTAQFETLLNEAPLGVYLVDGDFRIREINPTARRAFANLPNLVGRDFTEVIHILWPPAYADEIVSQFRRTLETGEPFIEAERVEERRDLGIQEVYEWQIHRIVLPDGRYGVVCYFRDISERKRAEERERQITAETIAATAKFRAVFEQTTVFAGIMTTDGVVIDANKLCLEACGYRAEEVLGKHLWETPWWREFPESQARIRAAWVQAAGGVPYRETLNYSWADGTERIVDFALYPIVDENGKILFLHPTGVEITDLKRAEENYRKLAETLDVEVRARTNELEERNVEVTRQSALLRDFSQRLLRAQDEERRRIARELHDSSGQLVAALGMSLSKLCDYVQEKDSSLAKDAQEAQQLVQQLSQEIRTMSYLLHPPLLDEIGLAEALRWYIKGLSERSGLEIQLHIPDDFGRLPREMELVVFRLVQECLTNIHRHSESETAVIRIERREDSMILEVQDHGKGIAADKLAQIQAHGSGVGMRGMRERARQFDGEMKIESTENGTSISFCFPLSKTAAAEENDEGMRAAG